MLLTDQGANELQYCWCLEFRKTLDQKVAETTKLVDIKSIQLIALIGKRWRMMKMDHCHCW